MMDKTPKLDVKQLQVFQSLCEGKRMDWRRNEDVMSKVGVIGNKSVKLDQMVCKWF